MYHISYDVNVRVWGWVEPDQSPEKLSLAVSGHLGSERGKCSIVDPLHSMYHYILYYIISYHIILHCTRIYYALFGLFGYIKKTKFCLKA